MASQQIMNNIKDPQLLMEAAGLYFNDKKGEEIEFQKNILEARALWLASNMGWWEARLKDKEYVADALPSLFKPTDKVSDLKMELVFLRTLLSRYPDFSKLPDGAAEAIRKVEAKAHPAIRRELLLALRNTEPSFAKSWIMDLAKSYDGKDRFYLEAIGIAVGHHDKARRDVILADFDKEFPEWNDKVADLVWELQPPVMMPSLGKRLADKSLTPEQRGRIVDILAVADDKAAGAALLTALEGDAPPEVRQKIIDNLKLYLPNKWHDLRDGKELAESIQRLLDKPETRITALNLIAAAEKTDAAAQVAKVAADAKEAEAVRVAAVQTLGVLPSNDGAAALAKLLDDGSPAVRVESALALGKLAQRKADQPGAAPALAALKAGFTRKDADLGVRQAEASALAETEPGSAWLIGLEEKKQLPDDVRPDVARLLRNSPFRHWQDKALALFPPPPKLDPKKLPPIAVLARRVGNAAKGKALLAASAKNDMQCLKCHTIRGAGGQVGPDLSMIGKKASRENLYESILLPSKAIADQYLQWKIDKNDGISISGIIVEETPTSITLRDANAKDTKIDKKDIDTRTKLAVSLMPENIVSYMTEDELADVVEYLATLKTPVLGLDWWHVAGPFDNGVDDAGLDRVFPPEKGIDPKATYDGKSGKVTWRIVKPDAQGYVDLRTFFAPESNEIVSYLYRDVESPADQDATVALGTDDGAKLWVNDKLVFTTRAHLAAAPEHDSVKVHLHKGKNRLLLKINNGDGEHGFYLTLSAEQELKRIEEK